MQAERRNKHLCLFYPEMPFTVTASDVTSALHPPLSTLGKDSMFGMIYRKFAKNIFFSTTDELTLRNNIKQRWNIMRCFMELAYDGGRYNGWQIQKNAPSVQQEIENALSTILREKTGVTGAGRTDTGVHAAFYVAHFDTSCQEADLDSLRYHLNRLLPSDIAIRRIYRTSDTAHARFDALEREYRYFMISQKDPFRERFAWEYHGKLDMEKMNRAAEFLKETDDFTTFAKLNSGNKTNICHVMNARWEEQTDGLVFIIRADRFLRNMVRAITGTLVDVGRGKITPEHFREILLARDLSLSGSSAPARGLFLYDIKYPDNIKQ